MDGSWTSMQELNYKTLRRKIGVNIYDLRFCQWLFRYNFLDAKSDKRNNI